MSTTPGRAFLDRRLALIEEGDIDAMVDEGYNEGALLVTFDGCIRGKDALKEHFQMHLPGLGGITMKSIDKVAETEDSVFFKMTVATGSYGDVTSYEGFVLRGGKADYHFSEVR